MQIADNVVASINYTLKNANGEVIDSSAGGEPLSYIQGVGNLIPGLEKELAGKQAGDSLQVTVAPEDGYGPLQDALIQTVPKEAFDGVEEISVGMRFQAQTAEGGVSVVVTEVSGDQVTVDGNHPLAGQDLFFDVEIVEVRAATEEEQSHGHVHGAGGCGH